MIQPNELRIGNWVRDDIVNLKDVQVEQIDPSENFEDLSPIPLTEEWLIKFGLIKGSKKNRTGNVFYLEIDNRRYYFVKYGKMFDWEFGDIAFAQLEYVHQFQNLIFALTGKELELT